MSEVGSVLVTGGAVFIGSHLTDHLLAAGHRVIVWDDLSTGELANLPSPHPGLTVVQGRAGAGSPVLAEAVGEVDAVFHLASSIGVRKAHEQPYLTAQNILRAGLEVTEACRRGSRPLVYASSSEVYGLSPVQAHEDATFQLGSQPRFSYAAAKLAVEHLVTGLHRSEGLSTWVVRPFNVVGSRQSAAGGHVLPSFVQAALTGQVMVVHGDGSQRRAFLHVADAVAALVALVEAPELVGEAVNLGGLESCSITELAALVTRIVGHPAETSIVPYQRTFGTGFVDPQDRRPDLGRLIAATGWAPARRLEEAVRDCADWLRPRLPTAAPAPAPAPATA